MVWTISPTSFPAQLISERITLQHEVEFLPNPPHASVKNSLPSLHANPAQSSLLSLLEPAPPTSFSPFPYIRTRTPSPSYPAISPLRIFAQVYNRSVYRVFEHAFVPDVEDLRRIHIGRSVPLLVAHSINPHLRPFPHSSSGSLSLDASLSILIPLPPDLTLFPYFTTASFSSSQRLLSELSLKFS